MVIALKFLISEQDDVDGSFIEEVVAEVLELSDSEIPSSECCSSDFIIVIETFEGNRIAYFCSHRRFYR